MEPAKTRRKLAFDQERAVLIQTTPAPLLGLVLVNWLHARHSRPGFRMVPAPPQIGDCRGPCTLAAQICAGGYVNGGLLPMLPGGKMGSLGLSWSREWLVL